VPCRAEHPLISRIAGDWPVFGINYKDTAADAAAWLDELGDPYRAIGADSEGRTGIDFGVYGMPETFVVDGDGIIRYRLASPLTDSEWQNTLLPLLRALTTENAP
jgi:cytochrome c biogenesis protein CcmG/thiol:disulfide interchange protein DsbE